MPTKQHPQRTCVTCREKKDKRLLIRLVLTDTGLQIDASGKMNGRGAYLCDAPDCWERAASSQILAKALRAEVSNDDRIYLRQIRPS
jgi:hypothetical protein